MPERFEIYIVYKRRYINTLPFLSFFLPSVTGADSASLLLCASLMIQENRRKKFTQLLDLTIRVHYE